MYGEVIYLVREGKCVNVGEVERERIKRENERGESDGSSPSQGVMSAGWESKGREGEGS